MGLLNMGSKCSAGSSSARAKSLSRRMPSAVTALKYACVTSLYFDSTSCKSTAGR